MILIVGIQSETPIRLVRMALDNSGIKYAFLNQRELPFAELSNALKEDRLVGRLCTANLQIDLGEVTAIYPRLIDERALPEVVNRVSEDPVFVRNAAVHRRLWQWMELSDALVINRARAMVSNGSKPFQSQLIKASGFLVPPTLVTSAPMAVRRFQRKHGRLIFKSASGIRSIVKEFGPEEAARLDLIKWCPTQFQAYIPGENLRVHVIGESVFAAAIQSEAIDYRYASKLTGTPARLRAVSLDPELATKCVSLTRSLGLEFAGVDLKVTDEGQIYCFEVNPSPGFSYFEEQTKLPIAAAVANRLARA